jgi:hypothetical protein
MRKKFAREFAAVGSEIWPVVRVSCGAVAAGAVELAIPPNLLTLAGDDALTFN